MEASSAWLPWGTISCHFARLSATRGCSICAKPLVCGASSFFAEGSRRNASSVPCLMARLASSSTALSAPPIRCTVQPAASSSACSARCGSCPGAENDVVHRQHAVLAVHGNVQAGVVHLAVLHPRNHLDLAVLERGAVDPARGLAQALAHLAGLALQQVDLAGNLAQVRFLQAAPVHTRGVHTPFGKEFGLVKAGAHALVQQVFGDIKTNATGANHRHRLAHSFLVAQDIQIAQYLGMGDTPSISGARGTMPVASTTCWKPSATRSCAATVRPSTSLTPVRSICLPK